jgi:hypothetical protein
MNVSLKMPQLETTESLDVIFKSLDDLNEADETKLEEL